MNRNSGDFTQQQQVVNNEPGISQEPAVQESRPLRSVLKRRPVSTYSVNSQDEAVLISQINESRTRILILERINGTLGWSIVGGHDSAYYKVTFV